MTLLGQTFCGSRWVCVWFEFKDVIEWTDLGRCSCWGSVLLHKVCQDRKIEISGRRLTFDSIVLDVSALNVILVMDLLKDNCDTFDHLWLF